MCGLCGLFQGTSHWTDSKLGEGTAALPRRQERLRRVTAVNRVLKHYRLKLSDWQGSAYLLSGPTGQSQVIDNIAALWPMAEAIARRPLDPLDPALIEYLERA